MSDEIKIVVCRCEICGATVVVEVWTEFTDEDTDDCLGIVCENCAGEE